MKHVLQILALLALILITRPANAGDSSFILNAATPVDGGGLSLSISTNHFGKATDANLYLSQTLPPRSLSELQKGLHVGKLTMDAGASMHTITLSHAQVKSLGVAEGAALFVTAHWPSLNHFWGQSGRPTQTFKFPKLKSVPRALSRPTNSGARRVTGLSRLRLTRRATRVR